jgi:hypothetical protein
MQQLARSGLSTDQVTYILRDAPAVLVGYGLELLDMSLSVVADITDDLAGGMVERHGYNTLHGTADLTISRDLDWGTALVRPYVTVSDYVNTARFNLGAYLTATPELASGEQPITHHVTGYDVLHVLNTKVGESYTVAAGTSYLDAVETILLAQGIQRYQIDQDKHDVVLGAPRSWALADRKTWLDVVNDLLQGIGYRGIWSDWDGSLRAEPYQLPTDRAAEWYHDDSDARAMLAIDSTATQDLFDAPNRWVFYWAADPDGPQPVEGAGKYTFVNYTDGPTSVEARRRTITADPMQIDAADQASLVSAAQITIDADLRLKTTYDVKSHPYPLWHFDRLSVNVPSVGPIMEVMVTDWTLPLNGDWMTQKWVLLQ